MSESHTRAQTAALRLQTAADELLAEVQRMPAHTRLGQIRDQVGERRGRNIGVVAAARELTELVFFGLRDGDVRRLSTPPQPAA